MIDDNQQLSEYVPSEIDDQSLNMQQESYDPELSKQAEDLPILNQYLSTDYKIFQDQNIALGQITQIKNKIDFEKKRNAMRSYFTQQQSRNGNVLEYRKQKDQISSQFIVAKIQNMASYSIIYVCVNELEANRCNILVRNSKGECLAFFQKQRKCKRLPKISKLLAKVKQPAMAFILDRTTKQEVNILQVEKLGNVVSDFLYIFQNAEHIQVKMHANILRSNAYEQKEEACTVQLAHNQLRIISPRISYITETDAVDILTQSIQRFEQEQAEALHAIKGFCGQNHRNLQFDFVFINAYRLFKCSPQQTIVKIQNLFMKQQQLFKQKDSILKQKQIERQHNKDPDCHFPYKMKQSKACKRCQLSYKKKITKINIGCEGCSIKFNRDIHLCPQCFAEFHQNIDFYASRIRLGRLNNKKGSSKKTLFAKNHQNEEIQCEQNEEKINQTTLKNKKTKNHPNKKQKICQKEILMYETNEKILKLDNLLTQTFQMTSKFIQEGHLKLMEGFLNDSFDKSVQRMHAITQKQSQSNPTSNEGTVKINENEKDNCINDKNKLTSFGSIVYQNICKYIFQQNHQFSQRIHLKQWLEAARRNIDSKQINQCKNDVKQQYQF